MNTIDIMYLFNDEIEGKLNNKVSRLIVNKFDNIKWTKYDKMFIFTLINYIYIYEDSILSYLYKKSTRRNKWREFFTEKERCENVLYSLWNCKLYKEYYNFFTQSIPKEFIDILLENKNYLFRLAYSCSEVNDNENAKKYYKQYLKIEHSSSVYNNLGIIYLKDGFLDKAKECYEKGLKIDPNSSNLKRNMEICIEKIEEKRKRPEKLKSNFFQKTDKYQKKILYTIYFAQKQNDIITNEVICQSLNRNTYESSLNYLKRNIGKLIELELVYEDEELGYKIAKEIIEIISGYIDPSVEREYIRISKHKNYKPIFAHESEMRLYRVLLELFPQHLIFPNMSLLTFMDVNAVKRYLDSELLDFMFKSHVDFAIVNTRTYVPVLCIEKDSSYHDTMESKARDIKKNELFTFSGIPLLRVRFNNNMTEERLKEEIRTYTKDIILNCIENNNQEWFEGVDFKKFNIFEKIPSLDIIQSSWKLIVGDYIYNATKRILISEKESEITIIIGEDARQIIDLGKDTILEKLYRLHPEINSIKINYE